MKKVVPGIHCSFYDFKNKKEELKGYQIKCKHVLTRGKRKNEQCGKNCQLGFQYCGIHMKSLKKILAAYKSSFDILGPKIIEVLSELYS